MKFLWIAILICTVFDSSVIAQSHEAIDVSIPIVFRKLASLDEAYDISFATLDHQAQMAGICLSNGVVRIAVNRDGHGEIFPLDRSIDKKPRVVFGDLNRDERPDAIVTSNKIEIFEVIPGGLKLYWASTEEFGNHAPRVKISDLNRDGIQDLIVLNYKVREEGPQTQSLYVYLGQKVVDQPFRLFDTITFTDEHGYHSTSGIAIADFFGGPDEEIIVGNDNGWLWSVRVSRNGLDVKESWKVSRGGAIGPALTAGNLDLEPKPELLVGTNGGDIHVYKFSPEGHPEAVAHRFAGRLAYSVDAGDIDGDGIDEFLLARGGLGYAGMTAKDVVTEIYKLGGGELQKIWLRPAEGMKYPRFVRHDIDRDGQLDMIVYDLHEPNGSIHAFRPILRH